MVILEEYFVAYTKIVLTLDPIVLALFDLFL